MKASIAHGVRPSALILGKDSKKPWGRTDIVLAKAYQRFLDELCTQCGLPKYICHTDDNRVQFRVVRDECEASKVAEKEQENVSKAKTRAYGLNVSAEPYLTEDAIAEGLEFSDLRRPYLKERARAMGLIPDPAVSGNDA